MFIPVIPVIHRPSSRFRALRDSDSGANVLLSQGSGLFGNGETLPGTAERRTAEVRKNRGRRKQGPGNRKEEARGRGASRSRTHFPSRVRRNLKPPGGRNGERTSKKFASSNVRQGTFNSKPQGREEGTRQGTEAGRKAGRGTRRNRNRISNDPAKEPEGPTGAARPRPEPPWERRSRLRAGSTEPGTVEAGSNAGLHFVSGCSPAKAGAQPHRPCRWIPAFAGKRAWGTPTPCPRLPGSPYRPGFVQHRRRPDRPCRRACRSRSHRVRRPGRSPRPRSARR